MGNEASKALEYAENRLELEYKARERETDLAIRKADMEHQHKIAELIAEMKQTKLQTGKELQLAYMETMKAIIQQNSTSFQTVKPLLEQLNNNKLSDSMKKSIENACAKVLNGYMDTQQLLDYSKEQIANLQLKQDEEFKRLLDYAVEQNVITANNKIYLLE
ncbi:10822_t:CDS:2 [Ambispora leptoticha]|uniref:10822_t:CDS:1 n=1 Tax=Ambispora leptoticha TaxID=144679 RepID=A0A9N9B8Z3_9GLOM|nr:10822_t:CDS:2 [Ambispora leptoticha]